MKLSVFRLYENVDAIPYSNENCVIIVARSTLTSRDLCNLCALLHRIVLFKRNVRWMPLWTC